MQRARPKRAHADISIREATSKDLRGLVKVNHMSQRTQAKNGLVQKRTCEEFKNLLKMSAHLIVAEHKGEVIGYTVVLDETAPYIENEFFSFYHKHYKKFIFIDSVAVRPDYRRRGIARAMYKSFLSSEKKRILVDFLITPKNSESMAFHESMGFSSIGDFIHLKNGMCAEVYEYSPPKKA